MVERLKSMQPNQVDLSNVSNLPNLVAVKNFEFKDISVDFVRKELCSLKITSLQASKTFKLVFCIIFYIIDDIIATPLSYILNLSLRTNIIPRSWKSANVTPLSKDGSISDPNIFRPISVLPVVMKIFERAVQSDISAFIIKQAAILPSIRL